MKGGLASKINVFSCKRFALKEVNAYLLVSFDEKEVWGLQRYYQSSSREIRRLQSITRSPVYATFNEILEGGACIRAFRQQRFFQHLNETQMSEMQRANMAGDFMVDTNKWWKYNPSRMDWRVSSLMCSTHSVCFCASPSK
jgi:hypothetical protein